MKKTKKSKNKLEGTDKPRLRSSPRWSLSLSPSPFSMSIVTFVDGDVDMLWVFGDGYVDFWFFIKLMIFFFFFFFFFFWRCCWTLLWKSNVGHTRKFNSMEFRSFSERNIRESDTPRNESDLNSENMKRKSVKNTQNTNLELEYRKDQNRRTRRWKRRRNLKTNYRGLKPGLKRNVMPTIYLENHYLFFCFFFLCDFLYLVFLKWFLHFFGFYDGRRRKWRGLAEKWRMKEREHG